MSIARHRRRRRPKKNLGANNEKQKKQNKKQASVSPLSLTVANKTLSFPPQPPRGWLPPNKNAILSAFERSAAASASDPLTATAGLARGLGLHAAETKALLLGKSGVVTFVPFSNATVSSSPAKDLLCFVEPATGQLTGLSQGGSLACSAAAGAAVVVVPTSKGHVSQIRLGYSFDGLFVTRLVFYLRANPTAMPVPYSCGSAGGKAVDLLPNDRGFVVTKLGVGCAPLPAAGAGRGRRRRLRQQSPPPSATLLGLSAGSFSVQATSLAAVTATGAMPAGLGEILAPAPLPPPPPPTPDPVTVTQSTVSVAYNATVLSISGSGFDAATPSANLVAFSTGLSGVAVAATATTLTVSPSPTQTASTGPLTAVVTVTSRGSGGGVTSGSPVQVATVLLPLLNWRGAGANAAGDRLFLAANTNETIWRSLDGGVSFAPTTAPIRSWQVIFVLFFFFLLLLCV